MRAGRGRKLLLGLDDALFVTLLVAGAGLLAWVAERYPVRADWTRLGDRSLAEPSRLIASRLEGPVLVTAFARPDPYLRRATRELVERYRLVNDALELEFVDPDRAPARVRELGITRDGEMTVENQGRTARATEPTEAALTNALLRVSQARQRWVVYLHGHGERDLLGRANHHLGRFGAQLEKRGYRVQGVDIARGGGIPGNTSVLVVSEPAAPLLPGEIQEVVDWVESGGNLLWLSDPEAGDELGPLASALGVGDVGGTVVEPRTQAYGLDDPSLALSSTYPPHAATAGIETLTLYPLATGLTVDPPEGWRASTLVATGAEAWSERGPLEGEVGFDGGVDQRGPLDLVVALERDLEPSADGELTVSRTQRVVVAGDGDFLSNTYLGNVGNLELGLALLHWLAGDDGLVDIPARAAPDARLELTRVEAGVIAIGSLLVVPVAFGLVGGAVWLRRRHR